MPRARLGRWPPLIVLRLSILCVVPGVLGGMGTGGGMGDGNGSFPTLAPTTQPTPAPSPTPTTAVPTAAPTALPTGGPTAPTTIPTFAPTATLVTTAPSSAAPTASPVTAAPSTVAPTSATAAPTNPPTGVPSPAPSGGNTAAPTVAAALSGSADGSDSVVIIVIVLVITGLLALILLLVVKRKRSTESADLPTRKVSGVAGDPHTPSPVGVRSQDRSSVAVSLRPNSTYVAANPAGSAGGGQGGLYTEPQYESGADVFGGIGKATEGSNGGHSNECPTPHYEPPPRADSWHGLPGKEPEYADVGTTGTLSEEALSEALATAVSAHHFDVMPLGAPPVAPDEIDVPLSANADYDGTLLPSNNPSVYGGVPLDANPEYGEVSTQSPTAAAGSASDPGSTLGSTGPHYEEPDLGPRWSTNPSGNYCGISAEAVGRVGKDVVDYEEVSPWSAAPVVYEEADQPPPKSAPQPEYATCPGEAVIMSSPRTDRAVREARPDGTGAAPLPAVVYNSAPVPSDPEYADASRLLGFQKPAEGGYSTPVKKSAGDRSYAQPVDTLVPPSSTYAAPEEYVEAGEP
eukprot:m.66120 g.66120  ORF g.66120 m.66120 type:complete len:574 (-) comp9800_c0_seq2:1496-3217(-)